MIHIAINGFGRIGRKLAHLLSESSDIKIVAINDLMPIDLASYFLQYDTTFGTKEYAVTIEEEYISFKNQKIQYSSVSEIEDLKWTDKGIDIIINCSGTNKTKFQLEKYLNLGIKKVILSSPPDTSDIPIIILGYNDAILTQKDYKIISNASCTTYCVAPILDIFEQELGVEMLYFTTIHSFTSDQNLQDAFHQDFRRARAAANNIIPTTTSATKVIKHIFPNLSQKIMGTSFRVPVINGSITEFVFNLKKETTKKQVLLLLEKNIKAKYSTILNTTSAPIVSSDILNCSFAALIDINSIEIVEGNYLKLTAFYDNETGYSNRLIELIRHIS